ncbi:hypothetical protein [Nonomuraea rhizosphaerae]|uniref:hypothetical protein n=1 Tax=Nonomuraea rhizosphaerae TaxID=2665663 RepID=UPI001C5F9642|nr:hypothetical protein [Nonomuraea rhizosphaerae]
MEQPYSAISGAGMAAMGTALLGGGRAKFATGLLLLMIADTPKQRQAAAEWQALADGLRAHPGRVQQSVQGVRWTGTSADMFDKTVLTHSNNVADTADKPAATADSLNTTADVFDALGTFALASGGAILTAGLLYRFGSSNPYTRPAAEVAATFFGRQVDRQAGQGAAKVGTFIQGTGGLLSKIAGRFAQMSPVKKLALVGGGAIMGGVGGQMAVAGDLSETALPQGNQVKGA